MNEAGPVRPPPARAASTAEGAGGTAAGAAGAEAGLTAGAVAPAEGPPGDARVNVTAALPETVRSEAINRPATPPARFARAFSTALPETFTAAPGAYTVPVTDTVAPPLIVTGAADADDC